MRVSDTAAPKTTYRKDYREPEFWIDDVELDFDLADDGVIVAAKLQMRRRQGAASDAPLTLLGDELETLSVSVDGAQLASGEAGYVASSESLTVHAVPADESSFTLETKVRIHPETNKTLSGLYRSSGNFCTQCEAEGFRRITWFLDRPDVMATYRVRIEADKEKYPVLLSNGNRIGQGEAANGRHWVRWEDPFRKPSYLFALVAGQLSCHDGTFSTKSGREVKLEIWVEPQNIDKCEHALESLKRSMTWDEETFGLEYDLDLYMIVAVSDFNMGAMENKGLNIFNSKYVLAKPSTATDAEYDGIESVIAHEYFHNWTGNRVTCRDWFQLTLKEGLTVFRDQQFSMDLWSAAVKRIENVKALRSAQFAEDSGPMAHPIRPESYVKMDNFYTATVYVKGSEVVRMYLTLLGRDGFRKGMDLYFERHDGQAVTCDDFRAAMADANGRDLTQFERWYRQAGTPTVVGASRPDATARTFTLTLAQDLPKVEGLAEPQALHIPVRVALIGKDGTPQRFALEEGGPLQDEAVLELTEMLQDFVLYEVEGEVLPSLLRDFSAPVKLEYEFSYDQLAVLAAHETDPFCRWEAGQEFATHQLLELAEKHAAGEAMRLDPRFVDVFRGILADDTLDGSMKDLALSLPGERVLIQKQEVWNPDSIGAARDFAARALAEALRDDLFAIQDAYEKSAYSFDKVGVDRRALQRRALLYLGLLDDERSNDLLEARFSDASNMTEEWSAFVSLVDSKDAARRGAAIERFYTKWKDDALVLDRWFQAQAMAFHGDDTARMRQLCEHADFKLDNPNRCRSVLGVFGMLNLRGFHDLSGAGYDFLAEKVLEVDSLNPQLASRLVRAFNHYKNFDAPRQAAQRAALERIAGHAGLSKDCCEIVGRALA